MKDKKRERKRQREKKSTKEKERHNEIGIQMVKCKMAAILNYYVVRYLNGPDHLNTQQLVRVTKNVRYSNVFGIHMFGIWIPSVCKRGREGKREI